MPCTRYFAPSSLPRLLLEDADELGADDLALGLGVRHAREAVEETLLGIDRHERHLEVVAEGGDHLLALVLSHQAVIDEDARELVADGAVDEQRGDRGVDPAREAADHAPVAHLRADPGDLVLDDRRGAPGHVAAADLLEERREDVAAVGRVHDLGVELDAVDAALDRFERRDRRLGRGRERREARGRLEDGVAVRHPAGLLVGQPGEQAALLAHGQLRAAELPDLGALDLAAELEHERLHAVADAQHGIPSSRSAGSSRGAPLRVHRRGTAGRIRPLGLRRRTSSTPTWWGSSSEKTPHSRTRRAISWEYCPP